MYLIAGWEIRESSMRLHATTWALTPLTVLWRRIISRRVA